MKKVSYRTEILVVLLVILVLLFFFIFIGYWAFFGKWMGVEDIRCSDGKPCTLDLVYPDGTCLNPKLNNETYCSPTDICFNKTCGAAYCNNGECVGERTCCRGICDVDSDCPELPWSPRLNDNPLGECISHSCVYTVVGSLTAICDSWLMDTPDNPIVSQGCIVYRFTDEGFPPGKRFTFFR